jgi:hypothetical protein
MVLFDGWNYGAKELERLFQIAGNPKIIVYILFLFFNVARFC